MSYLGLKVLVRGGGELASGVAHRMARCHFRVCLTEIPEPEAVRRAVSFSEAVYEGEKEVEGVTAKLVLSPDQVWAAWRDGKVPLVIDPEAGIKNLLKPDVFVDAIVAKKNLGTRMSDAPLVIGLGYGFEVGRDVHVVIETNRGHNLGKVIRHGGAEPDTGIPGEIAGFSIERVLKVPNYGKLSTRRQIGDHVEAGDVVFTVNGVPVQAGVAGVIRGLLRDGASVRPGMKAGDIDPRGKREYCYSISDKSRAVAGGVLEATLDAFNTQA